MSSERVTEIVDRLLSEKLSDDEQDAIDMVASDWGLEFDGPEYELLMKYVKGPRISREFDRLPDVVRAAIKELPPELR